MTLAYKDLVNPPVLTQPIYEPGKPIELVAAEYGLKPEEIAKLASNESALGPSPKAVEAIQKTASGVHLYPDGNATFLREARQEKWGLGTGSIYLRQWFKRSSRARSTCISQAWH